MTIDSYTKALLHCNGTDGSTVFTDEAASTWSVTSGPEIDTGQYVLGGASGKFSGSGYLSRTSNDLLLYGSDWCVEFRVRLSDTTQRVLFVSVSNTENYSTIEINNTKVTLYSKHNSVGLTRSITYAFSTATWYAVAIARQGANIRLFVNGGLVGTFLSIDMFENAAWHIGRGYDERTAFSGWLDEIRISKGTARYISDYTVETEEFGAEAQEPPPVFADEAVLYKIAPEIWMRQSPMTVSEHDEFYITDEIIGGLNITSVDTHLYLGATDKASEYIADVEVGMSTQSGSSGSLNRYSTGKISGLKGGNVYILSARVTIDGQVKTRKCEIRVNKENKYG